MYQCYVTFVYGLKNNVPLLNKVPISLLINLCALLTESDKTARITMPPTHRKSFLSVCAYFNSWQNKGWVPRSGPNQIRRHPDNVRRRCAKFRRSPQRFCNTSQSLPEEVGSAVLAALSAPPHRLTRVHPYTRIDLGPPRGCVSDLGAIGHGSTRRGRQNRLHLYSRFGQGRHTHTRFFCFSLPVSEISRAFCSVLIGWKNFSPEL